jgi:hypothetical protein
MLESWCHVRVKIETLQGVLAGSIKRYNEGGLKNLVLALQVCNAALEVVIYLSRGRAWAMAVLRYPGSLRRLRGS